MDPRYHFDLLPTGTADDDPRWEGLLGATRTSFLMSRPNGEQIAKLRELARLDDPRQAVVYADGDPMPATPVATFVSIDRRINVGHGRTLLCDLVSDVTVRASHRRRGLLRELMTRDLTAARDRGVPLAALTASEGTIYGRFGFAVSTRLARGEIDCAKFRLREPVSGSVEYVPLEVAREHQPRIVEQMLLASRGAIERWAFVGQYISGEMNEEATGPDLAIRSVAHLTDAGEIDGLAFYKHKESEGTEVDVLEVQAVDPAVSRALWAFLVSIDLVEKLTCVRFRPDDPLQWALADPRALKITALGDMIWLRVLDPLAALSQRGWDADGSLVLRVTDPMGFAEGTFAIEVSGGSASVERTDREPDATVSAETLASLYLGGVSAVSLAAAGRIDGDHARVAWLFTVLDQPFCPVGF